MKIGYLGILDKVKNGAEPAAPAADSCKSFTLSYDPDDPKLYSYAKITVGDKTFITDKALWDTGATITAISYAVARELDALPSDTGISISATDRSDSDIYLATVELPGGIVFHDVELWDIDLADHGAEIVIGMDIISRGTLVIGTTDGLPTFSFRIDPA